ncbi:nucleoside monophosphate kinase [Candidatus Saccharibacteria bacterium]|nr:nucleoside monophosphate kinase [Candidatus Saccharibacteria bacterium]
MNDQLQTVSSWLGSGSINIFGCPFAGKDTQGLLLADLLGAELIAGGEILRSHHDQEQIQKIMSMGGIIPSELYLQMLLPVLSSPKLKNVPLVLSTVGRAHGEEPIILEATEKSGHPVKAVLFLNVSEDEAWKRFEESKKRGDRGVRQDDSRESLIIRLKKFQQRTVPVIDFYREKGLLVDINGAQSEEEVTNEIISKLARIAS